MAMERACQHINLNHEEVERICNQYFQRKGSLESYELLSGGAVNTTLKICWADEWFVLKFYVRDRNLSSIEKCIYELVQSTVPIPQMLFASSPEEPYPFAIFQFCEKSHIYDISKTHFHNLSYDIGSTLAKIHQFQFPQAGLLGKGLKIETLFEKGSSPYFEYCLEHLTPSSLSWQRLGEDRSKLVLRFMDENRDYFPTVDNGGTLVHSDFKPVNLLWSEKGGLTVLDWEFAHSGDGLLDFGILLRHFMDFPLNFSSLIQGYEENGGRLPSNWIQKARIIDYVNIIQLLNTQSQRNKLFTSLISSVDFTMNKWNQLRKSMEELCPAK